MSKINTNQNFKKISFDTDRKSVKFLLCKYRLMTIELISYQNYNFASTYANIKILDFRNVN